MQQETMAAYSEMIVNSSCPNIELNSYTLPHLWNNLKIELKAQRNKTTFRIALQYDLLNPPDE
jgi:hypothetical protein